MNGRMKSIMMSVMGCVSILAFLVLCSEPMPGQEPGLWEFAWPKVVAIGVIALCVWGVNRLDREKIKD